MNKTAEATIIAAVRDLRADYLSLDNLRLLPVVYRVTEITALRGNANGMPYQATLYHDKLSLRVAWVSRQANAQIEVGDLVTPQWLGTTTCRDGAIRIARLVQLAKPMAAVNLFETIPSTWVAERELIKRGLRAMQHLSDPLRLVFNTMFWNKEKFHTYCTAPLSPAENKPYGILRSATTAATKACAFEPENPVAILAGLLRPAGIASALEQNGSGGWQWTYMGKTLDPITIVLAWIGCAVGRERIEINTSDFTELLQLLTASTSATALECGSLEETAQEPVQLELPLEGGA
jgi:3'-5' exoribonuclease